MENYVHSYTSLHSLKSQSRDRRLCFFSYQITDLFTLMFTTLSEGLSRDNTNIQREKNVAASNHAKWRPRTRKVTLVGFGRAAFGRAR